MQNIFRLSILIFFFIYNYQLKAQNPINVLITGSCNVASGNYVYNGLINSKNSYFKSFNDGNGGTINVYVKFDGTKWILNSGEVITDDILFINTNVTTSLLPPDSGWVLGNCANGTMTINEVLSNNQFKSFKIEIFPSPTQDFLEIKNNDISNNLIDYKIIDLTGRCVKSGKINNDKIDLRLLTSGNYILELSNNNSLSWKKIIKK